MTFLILDVMCSLPCVFLAWACEMTGLIVWTFRCLLSAHKHRPPIHHVCRNIISHVNPMTMPTSLLINACEKGFSLDLAITKNEADRVRLAKVIEFSIFRSRNVCGSFSLATRPANFPHDLTDIASTSNFHCGSRKIVSFKMPISYR